MAITQEQAAAQMLLHQRNSAALLNQERLQGLYQLRDYFRGQMSYGVGVHPSWAASLAQVEAQIRALGG